MFTIIGADGNEYGPVTGDTIKDWITAGRANLQTKVRRADETEWKTIGDFAEFNQPPALAVPAATGATIPTPTSFSPASSNGLELASRWLRLGAHLLDGLIGCLCLAPGFVMLVSAGVFSGQNHASTALLAGGFVILGSAILLLVVIQIYLLTTRGQTMGKKIVGIKIVNFDNDANPGFVKAVLLRILVNGLIGAVPFLGVLYSLVDILFIFGDSRRCLHDLIAGTKVVMA